MRRNGCYSKLNLLLVWGLVLLVVGCGSAPTYAPRGDRLNTFAVTFAPPVPYASALRTVTDLGLQPGFFCGNGPQTVVRPWQPVGQRDTFAQMHRLLVERVAVPDDWDGRLLQTPGVLSVLDGFPIYPGDTPRDVGTASMTYPCPALLPEATPPPGVAVPVSDGEVGIYARVTFTAPLAACDDALYAVSNLGLALANPCYDQIARRATPPPWQSPGQETAFAASPALVVVTTKFITSDRWQTQLRAIAGVRVIQSPYTAAC